MKREREKLEVTSYSFWVILLLMLFFVQWFFTSAFAFVDLSSRQLVNVQVNISCNEEGTSSALIPIEKSTDFSIDILKWSSRDRMTACGPLLQSFPVIVSLSPSADSFRVNIMLTDAEVHLIDGTSVFRLPTDHGQALDVFGPCLLKVEKPSNRLKLQLSLNKPVFEVITESLIAGERFNHVYAGLTVDVPLGTGFVRIEPSHAGPIRVANACPYDLLLPSGEVLISGNSTFVPPNSLLTVYDALHTSQKLWLIKHVNQARFSLTADGEAAATSYLSDEPLSFSGLQFVRPYGSSYVIVTSSYHDFVVENRTVPAVQEAPLRGGVAAQDGANIKVGSSRTIGLILHEINEPIITEETRRRVPSHVYFQLDRQFSIKNEVAINVTCELLLPHDICFDGSLNITRSAQGLLVKNNFDDDECIIEIDGVIVPQLTTLTLTASAIGSIIIKGERVTRFLISSLDFN